MMSEQLPSVLDIARELKDYADRLEGLPSARFVGNVRVSDVKRLCEAVILTWDPHPTLRMADDPSRKTRGIDEYLDQLEQSVSDGVRSFDWTTVLDLMAQIRSLREECEYRRDVADTERLGRRKAEEWLTSIKETFRPWWQSDWSHWNGSLGGLPVVVAGVADTIRGRERVAVHLLRALVELRDAFVGNRVLEGHLDQAKKAIDRAEEAGIVAKD